MGLLENKIEISKKFHTEWTETEIHWYGLEFSLNGIEEWIHLEYVPKFESNATLDGFRDKIAFIDIDVFARKENRTFELYDKILEMLSSTRIGNNGIRDITISGKDLISTDNGDYRVLKITVLLKTL